MPWKVCKPMDERLKFIARLLDGEQMAGLCREFGISRKTGYKILTRYNEIGLAGLTDRSSPKKDLAQPLKVQAAARFGLSTSARSIMAMPSTRSPTT